MAVGGGSWLQPDIDEQDHSVPGRGAQGGRSEQPYFCQPNVHGQAQSLTPHAPEYLAPYRKPPYAQWAPTEFNHISADGHTRQHVGHVYNTSSHSHYYSVLDQEANEILREQRGRALLKAAKEGQKPVVTRLLGAGADIEVTNPENGYSALHYASEGGFEDVVEILVGEGADVNLMSERYGTALHLACLKGHAAVASYLLQARADVHARGADVGQPLHCAIFHGSAEICIQLLDRGAKVNDRGDLHYGSMQSISCGDHTLGVIRGHMDCFPIDVAIDRESLELVKLLIKNGAKFDFSCPRWSPPWYHGDMVCLPGRAKVIEGIRPVIRAACLKDNAVLGLLLDSGASIFTDDGRGMNAVMYASRSGSADCLKHLVSRLSAKEILTPPMIGPMPPAIYITQRCNDGPNALEMAVEGWHKECIRILCQTIYKLAPWQQLWGSKPLHLASSLPHLDVILTILDAGFDVNSADEKGCTPILLAMMGSHEASIPDVVLALAERGAALNVTANDGCSIARLLVERISSNTMWERMAHEFVTITLERFCDDQVLRDTLHQQVQIKMYDVSHQTAGPFDQPIEQRLLQKVIEEGDWITAEVLKHLGAIGGNGVLDLGRRLPGTAWQMLAAIWKTPVTLWMMIPRTLVGPDKTSADVRYGTGLWDLARSINATEFLESYSKRYQPEGVAYRAGEREYRLIVENGKLKAL